MSKIQVIDQVSTDVIRFADPKEKYDGDDIYQNHFIRKIKIVENDYYDLDVGFEVEKGKSYFLVVVFYDTGDSFSRRENLVCFQDLFIDLKKAEALQSIIRKDAQNEKQTNVKYQNENGTWIPLLTSTWKGYFEHFRDCEIIAVDAI